MMIPTCLIPLALGVALGPTMALAGMTAEEFAAFTEGKTLTYSVDGEEYGIERYLGNRRVQWSFLDGECTEGVWYPQNGQICFAYDNWDTPQCWYFEMAGTGLIATFAGEGGDPGRYLAYEGTEEMVCLGPEIGV